MNNQIKNKINLIKAKLSKGLTSFKDMVKSAKEKVRHSRSKKSGANIFKSLTSGKLFGRIKKFFARKHSSFNPASLFPGAITAVNDDKRNNKRQEEGGESKFAQYFLSMPTRDQVIFSKRLAILIKAGVPILTSLDMLRQQASSKESAKIIGYLHDQVEKGRSLSEAMGHYSRIFGNFAVNIVRVGEMSGTLTQNLNYLADELKKKYELKRNIIGALVYPSFIIIATVGIIGLLTTYVFPKILPVFQSLGTKLPWSTRTLIGISYFMQHNWLYVIIGLILFVIGMNLILRISLIRRWNDRLSLSVPFLGTMFHNYHVANFTRTLGLLLKSEIGIIEALQIVSDTTGNMAYRKGFDEIIEGVRRGAGIADGMKDKLLFPPLVSQMVSVGETTGNLSTSLLYLAEIHEDEMNNSTKNLSTSIEPLLMIFMGLLVGFVAISIITPIYGITQSLRQ